MANYNAHIITGISAGYIFTVLCFVTNFIVSPILSFAIVFASFIGSILPDFDSDSGKPFQIILWFFSFIAGGATLIYFVQSNILKWYYWIFIPPIAIIFVRFAIGGIIKKFTVHRGIFHSIPAMFIAVFSTSTFLTVFNMSKTAVILISLSIGIGFLSHLILDEIYSTVNFEGIKIKAKKSFGTAITFTGFSAISTFIAYVVLSILIYLNWNLILYFIRNFRF